MSRLPRILFTWEVGTNFGHASKIAELVKELDGVEIIAAVRDVATMRGFLQDRPATVLPSPIHPDLRRVRSGFSYFDNLRKVGFNAPEVLGALYDSWTDLFELVSPDLIVCQSSPVALLAAQANAAPVINVGTGHDVPPLLSPLPPFSYWSNDKVAQATAGEAEVLDVVNAVLTARGRDPIDTMLGVLGAEETILATFPELDHYPPDMRAGQGQRYFGPLFTDTIGETLTWIKPNHRIFAYLRATDAASQALIAGLGAFGQACDMILASPNLAPALGQKLQEQGVRWVDGPVKLETLLTEADLCVNHASFGVATAAVIAGVPQVVVPTQAEQMMVGHAIGRSGVGVALKKDTPPEALRAVVQKALGDAPMRQKAKDLGVDIRGRHTARYASEIALRIVAHLERFSG